MPAADGVDGFDVLLSYTYAEELTDVTFSVSLTDYVLTTTPTTETYTLSLHDALPISTDLTPPDATEGQAFSDVVVFHFSDADPDGAAADYVATVEIGRAHVCTPVTQ